MGEKWIIEFSNGEMTLVHCAPGEDVAKLAEKICPLGATVTSIKILTGVF